MRTQTYRLCDLVVEVECQESGLEGNIRDLWHQLFVQNGDRAPASTAALRIHFRSSAHGMAEPVKGEKTFESPALKAWQTKEGFYLECGHSAIDLDLSRGRGIGVLNDEFWRLPHRDQREFLLLSVLILLRQHGLYGLHASAVVKEGMGCLIVGSSGSGKTTLAIGLVRQGWSYLSDDTVLVREAATGIEALALRRGFSYTPRTESCFSELGASYADAGFTKNGKRVANLDALFPGRLTAQCHPRMLLFPEIVEHRHSQLVPLDESDALCSLIRESIVTNKDRASMAQQLEVLMTLVQQARSYRFLAGNDVFEDQLAVSQLICQASEA